MFLTSESFLPKGALSDTIILLIFTSSIEIVFCVDKVYVFQ